MAFTGSLPEADSSPSEAYLLRDGAWVGAPRAVGMVSPPTRRVAAERGRLGYLVQSADARPLADDLCQLVVDALVQSYYGGVGSISGGLREALLNANEALFEHNVRADTASRLLVGISCIVVRGNDLYMARLGPASVWTFADGTVTQFPERSIWYAPGATDVTVEPPVGLRLDIVPELGQVEIGQHALVALLSQTLQRRAQPGELLRALGGDDAAHTRQRLQRITQGQDLTILAVGLVGEPAVAVDGADPESESVTMTASPVATDVGIAAATLIAAQPVADAAQSVTRDAEVLDSAEEEPVPDNVTQLPDEPTIGADGLAPLGADESSSPPAPLAAAPVFADDDLVADDEAEDDDDFDDDDDLDDDAWAEDEEDEDDDVVAPAVAPRREHIDLSERAGALAQGAGRAMQSGARRLRDGAEDALLKVLPDRLPERPEPNTARMPAISPASQSLVIIALLLPLLVLFTVIMVRVQHSRELDARRGSLIESARSEYDQALKAGSVELKADGLHRTIELTETGLAILPGDGELVDLRTRATLKLDELDKVERLFHFKRLDTYTVGGTVLNEPSRVMIYDKDALVLNKGAGQVHGYTLSDVGDAVSSRAETQVLLRTGEQRGVTTVAELIDLSWLAPTGSRTTGEFVALDRAGTLWALRNGAFEAVPVADSDTWVKPVAIGAFMGNLYVLDPLGGRILKYLPNNNAYTTPPYPYLSSTVTVDMLGAVDMAIDGNVYVLFADGTIHKFFDGEEKPFTMSGLPSGMRQPTSIFVSGAQEPEAEGWVYVTDRGNERIVQFDKAGNYIRSFKANTSEPYLTALGSVFVDETTQRIFVFSERQFALVALPPLPR